MRLISYETPWGWRSGVIVDSAVIDSAELAARAGLASEGDGRWTENRTILAAGPAALERLAEAAAEVAAGTPADLMELGALRLGPPITEPAKVLCLGLNYRDHAEEAGLPLPEAPMVFAKFSNSLAGPTDPIVLPPESEAVDYEAELAVVIGSRTKGVSVADALDCVAGVMALNDVTARDLQHRTSQWTTGKAIDSFAPCGPALVTLDEVGDIGALGVRAVVNGTTVQDGNTSDLIFGVAETIAHLAQTMTLEPGDVIATGTPAGVGFTRDPQILLQAGDVVEIEVENVGKLVNPVVARVAPAAPVA